MGEYTPEERREKLAAMSRASAAFYASAFQIGVHGFIEFCGLMNEFIDLCRDAEAQGIDWMHANVHSDAHLPFAPHHIAYLSEKLACIYGRRIQLVDDEKGDVSHVSPHR